MKANNLTLREITSYLEEIAPLDLQESYDNAGLITGQNEMPIQGVLFCLDATEAVIDDAINRGCNMVVTHHPIIFSGLKQITGAHYVERAIIKAIKNDIAIYAIHTNLDKVLLDGVNTKIAQKLGLTVEAALLPAGSSTYKIRPPEDLNIKGTLSDQLTSQNEASKLTGLGIIGNLATPSGERSFLELVRDRLNASCIRHTELLGRDIQKVAVCGGSGSSLIPQAIAHQADAFITADIKYHEFFESNAQILILDVGHFESEQFTIDLLYELFTKKFSNFAAYCTEVNTNPINYF